MKIPIPERYNTHPKERLLKTALTLLFGFSTFLLSAQTATSNNGIFSQPGVIITIILLLIPLLAALVLVVIKIEKLRKNLRLKKDIDEAGRFAKYLKTLSSEQIDELQKRQEQQPVASFKSPINFELDTRKLVDGDHFFTHCE